MTKLLLILALFPLHSFASGEARVTTAAAEEIYDHLALPVVAVREEHTGLQYGTAKYGKVFGCERDLDRTSAYCWFDGQEPTTNGLIRGAAALELYAALDLPEISVVDEHGNGEIAKAKYGQSFGCQRSGENGVECWFK